MKQLKKTVLGAFLAVLCAFGWATGPALAQDPADAMEPSEIPEAAQMQQPDRMGQPAGEQPAYEVHMANRTDIFWYGVTGPGQASSFYEPGWHILQENDFRAANLKDGWDSLFNLNVRTTDTDQFDPERFSIQRADWRVKKNNVTGYLGDYFANLSQYTMSQGIKGAAFKMQFQDADNYLTANYGSFDGQWSYLLRETDDEPMDRYGGGMRYQFAREGWRLGANLATVQDRRGDSNRAFEDVYDQWVGAFDWEYRSGPVVMNGEHAYAETEKDSVNAPRDNMYGTANRVGLRARLGVVTANARWERVEPWFVSVAGGATPDRTRSYVKLDTRVNRTFKLYGMFDYNANNIEDDGPVTTRNTTGELGTRFSRLFGRQSLNGTLALRRKWTDTSDDSRDMTSDRIKVSLSDRLWKTVRLKGQFEAILDDHAFDDQSPDDYFYDLEISSRHFLADRAWELSPSFQVGIQERENLTTGGDDVSEMVRAEMAAAYRRLLRMGLNVERNSNFFDQHTGIDSTRDRQNLYCESTPEWLKGGRLRVEVANNDYMFRDPTLGFNEKIVQFSVHFDLDKKDTKEGA